MICPVESFIVILRVPLTAVVETTPSFAALPPNMLKIFPSMPPRETWVFSRVLTSAHAGLAERATNDSRTAQDIDTRLIRVPPRAGLPGVRFSRRLVNCIRRVANAHLRAASFREVETASLDTRVALTNFSEGHGAKVSVS